MINLKAELLNLFNNGSPTLFNPSIISEMINRGSVTETTVNEHGVVHAFTEVIDDVVVENLFMFTNINHRAAADNQMTIYSKNRQLSLSLGIDNVNALSKLRFVDKITELCQLANMISGKLMLNRYYDNVDVYNSLTGFNITEVKVHGYTLFTYLSTYHRELEHSPLTRRLVIRSAEKVDAITALRTARSAREVIDPWLANVKTFDDALTAMRLDYEVTVVYRDDDYLVVKTSDNNQLVFIVDDGRPLLLTYDYVTTVEVIDQYATRDELNQLHDKVCLIANGRLAVIDQLAGN